MAAKRVHQTKKAFVTECLREEIVSGVYPGGHALRQESLAAQYECSLIPVREALLTLQGEGLVTFTPHKGAVVNIIDQNEIDEICVARVYLECDLLERALPHIDEQVLEKAHVAIAEFERVLASKSNLETWGHLNSEFHIILYEPAARPFTLNLVKNLLKSYERYVRLELQLESNQRQTIIDHSAILEHIKKKDGSSAIEALREDIMRSGSRLANKLSQ